MVQKSCFRHLFLNLTLMCDLALWTSHMVLVHFTLSHDGEHLCHVHVILNSCNWWKSYDKHVTLNCCLASVLATQSLITAHRLMIMKIWVKLYYIPVINEVAMDWTNCFSHLTLKCDLNLGPSQTILDHCTPLHDGEHLCQIILNSCN